MVSAVVAASLGPLTASAATSLSPLSTRLKGRMLLQVEQRGRAWYVDPATGARESFDRPAELLALAQRKSLGITDADIAKIPVGLPKELLGKDTDGDGVADAMEEALRMASDKRDTDGDGFDDRTELAQGHDPLSRTPLAVDAALVRRLAGRILLQVERAGAAWYVNPVDSKRYYLGTPEQALAVTRALALGITDKDIAQIETAQLSSVACGETASVDALFSADMHGRCFADRVRVCKPATWRLRSTISGQTAFIVDEEVVGESGSECLLKTTYVELGGAPELSGKSMVCRADRVAAAASLDQMLAGKASGSFSLSDGNAGFAGIEKCSGPLADAIRHFNSANPQ
jgi:hypothetical protein